MKFTKPLLNSSRSHTSFVCENLNHAAKTAVEKTAHWATRRIHSSHFGLFFVTISFEYNFVRTVSMVPFCFVLILVEYIPHVLDCFPCWLHCFVAAFVDDYLKQVISICGTFPSICSMGFSHGFFLFHVFAISLR